MTIDAIPLSVCIIVKNEEEKLPQCLASVQWVPEVIVIDDFSTDRTPQICQSFKNVRCGTRKFDGFGFQKAYAVSLVSNDWVLNIDADEIVTPELKEEILQSVLRGTSCVGFKMRRKNLVFGQYQVDTYPGTLRLFRKDSGNYRPDYVHERVEVNGPIGQIESFLLHHPRSFETFADHYETYVLKYGRLAALDYRERGRQVTILNALWLIVLLPLMVFLREFLVKRKFMLGKAGVIVSVCSAMCYHKAYWYLIKLQREGR